ncbi:MAG: IS110 family transposase [Verrucomicrobiota bacterium]
MKTTSSTTIPKITIGLDLGDRKHAVCVLNEDGEITEEKAITNCRESLHRLAADYPGARVAMEVGMHSPWTSRLLEELGLEVLVANARKLRAIYQSSRKSDEADAHMLARIGRFDPQLLYPIQHTDAERQQDLLRLKLRDNLVRQRVDIISAIRFTLKSLGLRLPSPKTTSFAKRAREVLAKHPEVLAMIEPSLRVLDAMKEQIRELEREIHRLCEEKYPETQRLQQIRGIGPMTSLCFVLTVGDPTRFERPRDVGAWLGLVPKRDQSGKLDKELGISRAGDAYLRRLLVSAAQYLLGPFGEDCDLRTKGLALAERGGRGAKKKAVVATARKLAVVMMTLWQKEAEYLPQLQSA